jgi:hypothetical protein
MYFKRKQVILDMSFKKRLAYILGISILLFVQACQPDDDSPFSEDNKPQPDAFTFSAKLNGTNWKGTQNLSLLVKNSTGSQYKEMRISANSTDGKLLTLTLDDASTGVTGDGIAVKTYSLRTTGNADASFLYVNTKTNSTYIGAYGTVTIIQSNAAVKKLSGTFTCTLYQSPGDTMRITNGVLTDVPYDITEE